MSTADAGMPTDYAEVQAAQSEAAGSAGLNFASIGQTYETTIHADNVPSMRFVSIPRRAPEPETTYPVEEVLQILGLAERGSRRFFPAELPWVLWECLTAGRHDLRGDRAVWSDEDRRLFEFAEYLAFEDLIPFELSAQQSRSLAKLMCGGATMGAAVGAAAAGAKVGTVGGLVIGAAGGPLIFITTPVGFVVGGLVGAVTGALGERLFHRLRVSPDS
jgi:hypothetical protein